MGLGVAAFATVLALSGYSPTGVQDQGQDQGQTQVQGQAQDPQDKTFFGVTAEWDALDSEGAKVLLTHDFAPMVGAKFSPKHQWEFPFGSFGFVKMPEATS